MVSKPQHTKCTLLVRKNRKLDVMYDGPLLTILHQHTSLPSFLDTVFSFLARKTDLFEPLSQERGFPEGKAQQLVIDAFQKQVNLRSATNPAKPIVSPTASSQQSMTRAKPYNGGQTAGYTWSQTLDEVTMEIPVPSTTHKSHISVVITNRSIEVAKDSDKIVTGSLYASINKEESTWTLSDSVLSITMEKGNKTWWKSVIKGHEEIDTSQVDSSKKMSDFDEETQGKIRQLIFDEHQKRQGLPTSEDLILEEKLKAAWNVETSPFKGTPFDREILKASFK